MDEDVTDQTAGAPQSGPAAAAGGGTVIEAFPGELGAGGAIARAVVAMRRAALPVRPTHRWREMDSNHWSRSEKGLAFRDHLDPSLVPSPPREGLTSPNGPGVYIRFAPSA